MSFRALQHGWHAFRSQHRIEFAKFIVYNLSNRTGFGKRGIDGPNGHRAHAPPLRNTPQTMARMHDRRARIARFA
jgi:hypothetical protein